MVETTHDYDGVSIGDAMNLEECAKLIGEQADEIDKLKAENERLRGLVHKGTRSIRKLVLLARSRRRLLG